MSEHRHRTVASLLQVYPAVERIEQDYPISRALDLKDLVDPLLCQEYAYTICAVGVTRPEDFIGRVFSFQPSHLGAGLGRTLHAFPPGLLQKTDVESPSVGSFHYLSTPAFHRTNVCSIS